MKTERVSYDVITPRAARPRHGIISHRFFLLGKTKGDERMNRHTALCICAVLALLSVSLGCKATEDITPAPTAKPEVPNVVVTNQQLPPEHSIEVQGRGAVAATPDQSTITIGVQGEGETAEEATQVCEETAQGVRDIAAAQGVLPRDVSASGVALSTKQRESDGAITGYVAVDTITIVTSDVGAANAILSAIIDAGITESYEVLYSLTDASSAYREALAAAMADALDRATALAEASGVTLGAVVGVAEKPVEDPLTSVASESSTIQVSAEVTVRYLIP